MGCSVSHSSHEKMRSYREQLRDEETTITYYRGQPDGEENLEQIEQSIHSAPSEKGKNQKLDKMVFYVDESSSDSGEFSDSVIESATNNEVTTTSTSPNMPKTHKGNGNHENMNSRVTNTTKGEQRVALLE